VLYTRDTDKYVSLEDRAVTANIKGADLFISLHANANRSSKVSGFETYYLGKARNDVVLRLAAKENNVAPAKISDTQKIVMDLVHSFKIAESRDLAKVVQNNTIGNLRKHYKSVRDNGARSAPFFVLIGAKMPAILIEIGYTSNAMEAERLKSEAYLNRVADGIVDGIEAYKQDIRTAGL
jgi:N-acetylmuramoyl-L-alanine amidase